MVNADIRWLVGGVVLGQVAPRVLASDAAKKVYVQGIAACMRARAAYLDLVEQARAEVDDRWPRPPTSMPGRRMRPQANSNEPCATPSNTRSPDAFAFGSTAS